MSKTPLPFFESVFQLKKKSPKDLPDIPQLLGGEMLSLKDDCYRLVFRQLNRETNKQNVEIAITMYYNIFALAFGYDTLELYLEINGKRKHVKYINLYEKLNSREQAIIDYISGTLKVMREMDTLLAGSDTVFKFKGGDYTNRINERRKYRDLFAMDENQTTFTGMKVEAINSKFPEIKMLGGKAYMYKSSYFESSNYANNSSPILSIPVTGHYRDIAKIAASTILDDTNPRAHYEVFKESCHQLILMGIDPMSTFVNSNFIKPSQSRISISDMRPEEKAMVANFMLAAQLNMPRSSDEDAFKNRYISDVKIANSYTNFKKITTVLFFEGFDEDLLSNLRLSLTKRNKPQDVIAIRDFAPIIEAQSSIKERSRTGDLGGFPVNISREKMNASGISSFKVDFAIERDQKLDDDIEVYTASRTVSRDPNANNSFAITDLKLSSKLITSVFQPVVADFLLKRDFIFNRRTGEMMLNSTVSPNKIMGHYNKSRIKQLLENVKLYVATISRGDAQNARYPRNVIKICNKHSDISVSRVLCRPNGTGSPFELPVLDSQSNEVSHVSPVPGARYTYEVFFIEKNGYSDFQSISIPHRTFRMGLPNINLSVTSRNTQGAIITVSEEGSQSIAANIKTSLSNMFSGTDAQTFYTENFAERVNKNLQNIGSLYQLYVTLYDKKTGSITTFVQSSVTNNAGQIQFKIPVNRTRTNYAGGSDYIVSYNLIITNPIELVTAGFDDIEDPKTRKLFKRRTEAYFNTFTMANGQLPAEVHDKKSGFTFYAHESRSNYKDPFHRVTCIGGMLEDSKSSERVYHDIRYVSALYHPDDGECIVRFACQQNDVFTQSAHEQIDFFVITAEINGVEIPIEARPFTGYMTYQVRTNTFLGAASSVKFRVYTVYNDFQVQLPPSDSCQVEITDTRKRIQEL